MLTPEKEAALSHFNAEFELGNEKKADQIKNEFKHLISGQDILDWEQLHERPIRGWD